MKKNILQFILILFISGNLAAASAPAIDGDYKNMFADAEEFFTNENYSAALPLYLKLDSIKGNANLKFKVGFCYLNASTYKTKSVPYLEEAVKDIAKKYMEGEISEKQAPLSATYYLAMAYHLNYDFDKAIAMYETYKAALGKSSKYSKDVEEIDHNIETCNNGKVLVKDPKKITVTNLGEGINSAYPDYSPVVSLDEKTIIFTTRRQGGFSDDKELNGKYFEDIFVSENKDDRWEKARPIGNNINTAGHEATVNLSFDGSKLLIYKDNNGNGDLYLSEIKAQEWSVPEYISAPINSFSWESHACFTSDNRILYFVSDRSGGFGGRDIYKCLKLPNGEWGPAENLGAGINTKYDEDGIFIHPDGKQIFFSSKGHNSMGGFDIFSANVNSENGFWSAPVNIGYPINTPDDDVFYVTAADGRRAYYSSDKEGGFGEKDIYMITFPEFEPRDIAILVGRIVNNTKEDITNNTITLINTKTNDTLQVIKANGELNKFGTNLPVGASYKAIYSVNGKEFFSETITAAKGKGYEVFNREIPYGAETAAKTDSTAAADSVAKPAAGLCNSGSSRFELYFGYNKKSIDTKANDYILFIDALFNCLNENAGAEISIESSASKVPTSTFGSNENLSKLRAKEAKDKMEISLKDKGLSKSKINFEEPKNVVQGPEYKNDFVQNRLKYEKYQYIKIALKLKK